MLAKKKPVLLVLTASWCPSCLPYLRLLDKSGVEYELLDLESREGARLSEELGVSAVPEVLVRLSDGTLMSLGMPDPDALVELEQSVVCDIRTGKCGVPREVARGCENCASRGW